MVTSIRGRLLLRERLWRANKLRDVDFCGAHYSRYTITNSHTIGIAGAIRDCSVPDFGSDKDARDVYEFARQLVQSGDVDSDIYDGIVAHWREVGVVELTAVSCN